MEIFKQKDFWNNVYWVHRLLSPRSDPMRIRDLIENKDGVFERINVFCTSRLEHLTFLLDFPLESQTSGKGRTPKVELLSLSRKNVGIDIITEKSRHRHDDSEGNCFWISPKTLEPVQGVHRLKSFLGRLSQIGLRGWNYRLVGVLD